MAFSIVSALSIAKTKKQPVAEQRADFWRIRASDGEGLGMGKHPSPRTSPSASTPRPLLGLGHAPAATAPALGEALQEGQRERASSPGARWEKQYISHVLGCRNVLRWLEYRENVCQTFCME